MTQACKICGKKITRGCRSTTCDIVGKICESCHRQLPTGTGNSAWLEAIDAPILLLQGKPRQVVGANRRALALFGKELSEVAGHRGGQVFDCLHSFTEAGCGLDSNCERCKIKDAIVETFTTSAPHAVISTLPIKNGDETSTYLLQISTQKIGDLALVRVERYENMESAGEGGLRRSQGLCENASSDAPASCFGDAVAGNRNNQSRRSTTK